MKKIILLCFICFNVILLAQPTHYFSKSFNYGNKEVGAKLDTCSDGIIMGSWSDGSELSVDIVKTDFKGNLIWKKSRKEWDMFDMQVINDTIYFSANNYFTEGKQDILFEAMSINGDSIFHRIYGDDTKKEHAHEFCRTEDGGFIFFGKSDWNTGNYDEKLRIFKVDRYGKVVWDKQVEVTKNMSQFTINGIDKVDKDEFLLKYYGYVVNDPKPLIIIWGGMPIKKLFFTTIRGKDGKELKTNRLYTDSLKETSMRLAPISKKRYFADLHLFSDTSKIGQHEGWANQTAILDSNFQYISKGSRFLQRYTFHGIKFKELKDGTFMVCGLNRNNDTLTTKYRGGPWVAHYDAKGFLLWDRVIVDWRYAYYDDLSLFYDMEILGNGDILLSGSFANEESSNDMWLLRIDSNGCPFPNCKGRLQNITKEINEVKTLSNELDDVKVFPNPASERLVIELYDKSTTDQIDVSVFDALGQMYIKERVNASDSIFTIDVAALPSGTYLLRIQNKEGAFSIKKFVKF
jgi:Secretion system C-terminal sorting domain